MTKPPRYVDKETGELVCPQCGYSADLYADHNTEHGWYCNNCDLTFEEIGNEDQN